jgi:hypothetical protein
MDGNQTCFCTLHVHHSLSPMEFNDPSSHASPWLRWACLLCRSRRLKNIDSSASRLRIRRSDSPFQEAMSRNTTGSRSIPASRPYDRAEPESPQEATEWSDGMGEGPGSRNFGDAFMGRDSEWQRVGTDATSLSSRDARARDYGEHNAGMNIKTPAVCE